jgi:hypothetical protein
VLIPGIDDRLTLSALSLLVGFVLARLADRLRAGDQQRVAAKAAALPLLAIGKALRKHRIVLHDALSKDEGALRAYYKLVVELVAPGDLDELGSQVRGGAHLPHRTLETLRNAHDSTSRAQNRHDQLRQTVEVSPTPGSDGEAYRRLVLTASEAVLAGLQHLARLGPTDTRRAITDFIRETQ